MSDAQFAIILPAAGRSVRFGSVRGKLLEPLAGQTVLSRSVQAFLVRDDVAAVIIAAPSGDFSTIREALGPQASDSRIHFCRGGESRAHSVKNALRHVPKDLDWVAVHDAARPLVSQALIDRAFAAALEHGSAVPALPVSLTIKRARGPLPAIVEQTIPRQDLWAMQTPQVMRVADLSEGFKTCPFSLELVTDDAQVLELAGKPVWLVEGEESNLKITTRNDLRIAELILSGL